MIGFVRALLEEVVLEPQSGDDVDEAFRADLRPEARELGVVAQDLDVQSLTTEPVSFEIGGGMTLRHRIDVAVSVQHGDNREAVRIRDRIVLDLCLRAYDNVDQLEDPRDDATGQYVTDVRWTVDYRLLPGIPLDTPNETATIAFVIDTQLDR